MVDRQQFDIFLAHNSKDKAQVRRLAQELKKQGLKPWIDEEQIRLGDPIPATIQSGIVQSRTFACFVGTEGFGTFQGCWELDALIMLAAKNKVRVIPILLPGVYDLPNEQAFIASRRYLKFHQSVDEHEPLMELVQIIRNGDTIESAVGIVNTTYEVFQDDDRISGIAQNVLGEETSIAVSNKTASQDELQQRLTFAKINVSIWAHCCRADGKLSTEEDKLTDLMIASLFEADSLLAEVSDRNLAFRELLETFNDPFTVESIAKVIRNSNEIATSFYQEACLIMAIDDSIKLSEREFLNNLAREFNISQSDKKSIEQRYLKLS